MLFSSRKNYITTAKHIVLSRDPSRRRQMQTRLLILEVHRAPSATSAHTTGIHTPSGKYQIFLCMISQHLMSAKYVPNKNQTLIAQKNLLLHSTYLIVFSVTKNTVKILTSKYIQN